MSAIATEGIDHTASTELEYDRAFQSATHTQPRLNGDQGGRSEITTLIALLAQLPTTAKPERRSLCKIGESLSTF